MYTINDEQIVNFKNLFIIFRKLLQHLLENKKYLLYNNLDYNISRR